MVSHLGNVDLGVVEIVPGVFEDEGAVLFGEFAAKLGGYAGPQGAGRNDGVFWDDGAGGDDGAGTDAAIVQHTGADADEAFVFNHAAMNRGVVADGDPVADNDPVEIALAMEDGAVLDVGVGAYVNRIDVAAKHGIHPDRGVLPEGDVADKLGGEIDITAGMDLGDAALVTADHGKKPPDRLFHFEVGLVCAGQRLT